MTPLIIGNWKMYLGAQESVRYWDSFSPRVRKGALEIAIAPSFPVLPLVRDRARRKKIALASQDVAPSNEPAFTGEVGASMLRELGVTYVLVGHSERRRYAHETEEDIHAKILSVVEAKMVPVLCIGETAAERRRGNTLTVLRRELRSALDGVNHTRVVVAYEPVWAIGTGHEDTPNDAESVLEMIRAEVGSTVRLLYGGSVDQENVMHFRSVKNLNGFLVGHASADPLVFATLIKRFVRA